MWLTNYSDSHNYLSKNDFKKSRKSGLFGLVAFTRLGSIALSLSKNGTKPVFLKTEYLNQLKSQPQLP